MSLKDIKKLNLGNHGVDLNNKRKREDEIIKSSILKTETPKKLNESRSERKTRRSTAAVSMPSTASTTVRKRNHVDKLITSDCRKIARRLDMHEFAK